MTKTALFEGGCACRNVRYRLTNTPLIVHACHCRYCQRESGSAFALNLLIENSALELVQGAPIFVEMPTQSGKGQKIARCPDCHIALWSHYALANKNVVFVRVGTLDSPDDFPPDVHIFTATKPPWLTLDAHVPVKTGLYSQAKLWRKESMARYAVLRTTKYSIEHVSTLIVRGLGEDFFAVIVHSRRSYVFAKNKLFVYNSPMIQSFLNSETERFFRTGKSRRLAPDIKKRTMMRLLQIEAATNIEDLRLPPSNHLKLLTNDLSDVWSIRINEQWRICFRWHEGDAFDVGIVDYH